MKNIINRILKIISSAIFIVLLIIIGILLVYIVRVNFLAGEDRLGDIKINVYTILTQSMYPTIKAGDIVVTYKNDDNIYNEGDIITFVSANNAGVNITHRISEIYCVNDVYSYRTKGDNNNASDSEIVQSNSILGKVIFKVPKAGYIQQFLVSKTGWICAVILPALAIIIYDLIKVFSAITGIKLGKDIKFGLNDERTSEARKRLKEVVSDNEKEE